MKVVVLGDTGMLGGMLKRYLEKQDDIDVVGLSRKDGLNVGPYFNEAQTLNAIDVLDSPDFIINCIGAIKPVFNDKARQTEAIYTNAVFPHELVSWNHRFEVGAKIIHITTDCVFDGADGGYTEKRPHNALDDYGRSKSLGEPDDCMVLRTSIIGPEWNGNKRSLLQWFLGRGNVNGYDNHIWNGLTTLELSRCISDIINMELYSNGTYHLFSNDVTKYELLRIMESWWKLGIAVHKTSAPHICNRTLRTTKSLNNTLKPSGIEKMIEDLTPFIRRPRTSMFDEPIAVYPLKYKVEDDV